MKFNFLKLKKENEKNKIEELLKIIEENKIQIEEYKESLTSANEKIKVLEEELRIIKEKYLEDENNYATKENKEEIEVLILGNNNIDLEEDIILSEECSSEKLEQKEELESKSLNDKDIDSKIKNEDEVIYNDNKIKDNNIQSDLYEENILTILKEYYLLNNEEKIKTILDTIISKIKILEKEFDTNDMLLLIYISYFNNLLEKLLNESDEINKYYLSNSREITLLNIIIEERKCKVYESITECSQNYIKINRNIFEGFVDEIKEKLIDDINKLTYRAFNFTYKINSIEYGVDTHNITAWARDNENSTWRLVEGLVSDSGHEFYLLQTVIKILNLRTIDIANLPKKEEEVS